MKKTRIKGFALVSGVKVSDHVPDFETYDLKSFGPAFTIRNGSGDSYWVRVWECKCGEVLTVRESKVKCGHTRSCGCLQRKQSGVACKKRSTHSQTRTREYKAWQSMKTRCLGPECKDYPSYAGRGIFVCERWLDKSNGFANFLGDMGKIPDSKDHFSLDRINNDGPYSPDNCRWATSRQQMNNHRKNVRLEFNGRTLTVAEWSREVGIRVYVLRIRLRLGWSVEKTLTKPVEARRPRKRLATANG